MSRSRAKKYRICKTDTSAKRTANKKVRKTEDIPDGNSYKKLFCSWNINDGGKARKIPKLNEDSTDWEKEWIPKVKRK